MLINNILSLFDGMSCGAIALERAGIEYNNYYASEIDKYAIQISKKNYPNIIHLGDAEHLEYSELSNIDLLLAGFPCQSFSIAGARAGLNDRRGGLVNCIFEALKTTKPETFLLENVLGLLSIDNGDSFTNILKSLNNCGYAVDWIVINSALVSAQNRRRVYIIGMRLDKCHSFIGTIRDNKPSVQQSIFDNENIMLFESGIKQPADKGILLKDIISQDCTIKINGVYKLKNDKANCIDANYYKGTDNHGQRTCVYVGDADINGRKSDNKVYSADGKSPCLMANSGGNKWVKIAIEKKYWRKLTPMECEKLQTLPDNYTEGVSNSQRYKMIGNGMTIDAIAHLLKGLL